MEEVDYWLTRFILEVVRGDGKSYAANSSYASMLYFLLSMFYIEYTN